MWDLSCPSPSLSPVNITVGYNPILYTTSQGQGAVVLNITVFDPLTRGSPRPFTLVVNTEDGTASKFLPTQQTCWHYTHVQCNTVASAPDNDYEAVSGEIVQFNVGDTYRIHTIIINDDDECENDPNEFFFSNIALNSGVQPIHVINPQATVTIDDSREAECREH